MLPSKNQAIRRDREETSPSEISIGAPVIADFSNYRILGYYAGLDSDVLKIGFAKEIDRGVIRDVNHEIYLPYPKKVKIIVDIHKEKSGRLLSWGLEKLPRGNIAEVSNRRVGFIGFWDGVEGDDFFMNSVFNKQEERYHGLNEVKFLRDFNSDILERARYMPKVEDIVRVSLGKISKE